MGFMQAINAFGNRLVKRYTLRQPSEESRWGFLGGTVTDSGLYINRHTAMTLGTVWQAVNLISYDVAKIPLIVYERNGESLEKASTHSAYRLLRYRPNQFQTPVNFWSMVMADALLGRGGYILVDRMPINRKPRQLIRLLPDHVEVVKKDDIPGSGFSYVYRPPGLPETIYNYEDVIHIHGLSWDGLDGMYWTGHARESIGYALALQKYGNKFFGNSGIPNVVLKTDKRLDKEAIQNTRDSWEAMFGGVDNAHKTAVLQLGLDVSTISIDPRNAQMIEAKQFSVREIAAWFNLPPHKLGDDSRTSHNSLEMEDRSYSGSTLDRWWTIIEQECYAKLLTDQQQLKDSHTIEFLREQAVRTDTNAKTNMATAALAGHPWMKINEVRSQFGLNPVPEGDEIVAPSNNFQGDDEPSPSDGEDTPPPEIDPPPNDQMQKSARSVLERELKRAVSRVAKDARTSAKTGKRMMEWINEKSDNHVDIIVENLSDVLILNGSEIDAKDLAHNIVNEVRELCLDISGKVKTDVELLEWVDSGLEDYESEFLKNCNPKIFGRAYL